MTPLAGPVARLQSVIAAATVNHEFENWDLGLETNLVKVNGFEKTADGDSNYWNSYLACLCSGLANFGGRWNTTITPTNSFRQGNAFTYTSLFCGLTHVIGFLLTGKCKSIGADTNVDDAANFKGVFQIEGVTTYPN